MRTIGELVSERTGEKEKGGKKERERGAVLHHPELARIPSLRTLRRCVSAHQCTWHPSEFSLLSLSLFLSSSSRLSFIPVHLSLSLSLSRSNLALALSARFLFSSYFASSSKLTHPFLTLCTGIPGVGVIFEDIDSSGRATGRAELPVEYYRRRRGVIDGSLLSGRWPQKEFLEIFSLPEIFSV